MDASLVVQAPISGDYRAPQSTPLKASTESCIPYVVNVDDARSEIGGEILETKHQGVGHIHRPVFSGRLFSLKNSKKKRMAGSGTTGNWGGRMFDYDQKYEIDEWGAEMGPESRFCKMYVDETEIYDLERVDSWRDVLDVLLVFIGLFSAIVTTFVIQTSQALQPDYGQLTATLVYNLVLVQRALLNGNLASVPLPKDPADPSVSPSLIEKWVNGLWFTSLAISLSTALVTILTKQWLYHYMSQTSGSSRDRARLRQFRFAGLEKYHVPMIIDLLPVALHIALALFLVGLALFLSALNHMMATTVIVISSTAYISYIISALLPLYDPQCPYQSPISDYIHHFVVRAPRLVLVLKGAIFRGILKCIVSLQRHVPQVIQSDHSSTSYEESFMWPPPFRILSLQSWKWKLDGCIGHVSDLLTSTPASLQVEERQVVLEHCHQLDIDAITWLFSTSSNSTVRRISFLASIGLTPSAADTSRLRDVFYPYRSDLPIEGLEHSQIRIVASINGRGRPQMSSPFEDVHVDEEDGYRVFGSLIFPTLFWNVIPSQRDKWLVITDFLAPGPRAHLRLPFSVWRLCITELMVPFIPLDPIMVMRLLPTFLPQREEIISSSPATFADAIKSNPYLQTLMMDLLAKKLGIQRDTISTFTSTSLQTSIMIWAISHLDESSPDPHFVWGEKPYEIAIQLLRACIEHAPRGIFYTFSMDTTARLRDSCTLSLSRALSVDSPTIQWKVYFILADLLSSFWRIQPDLSCPPELLSALLSFCTTTTGTPVQPDEESGALHAIPSIVSGSEDDARASHYNMLREHDILPMALAKSGGDESYSSQFWTVEMCHVAVFSLRHAVDTTAEWAQNWIHYIDTPERLSFIFKRLLREETSRDRDDLNTRISPWLNFAATSANWRAIFPSLIVLLENDAFISSIGGCHNPRHQLSDILLHIQKQTTFNSVDLSMYDVPLFDEKDNIIPPDIPSNATHCLESAPLSALESPSSSPEVSLTRDRLDLPQPTGSIVESSSTQDGSDAEPEQPTDETIGAPSSNDMTVARVWNGTAIVRFSEPLAPPPDRTPREMEEAVGGA